MLAKLTAFYTVFYFFLGCFFLALVSVFSSLLNLREPRYFNAESAMAVKSAGAVGEDYRWNESINRFSFLF